MKFQRINQTIEWKCLVPRHFRDTQIGAPCSFKSCSVYKSNSEQFMSISSDISYIFLNVRYGLHFIFLWSILYSMLLLNRALQRNLVLVNGLFLNVLSKYSLEHFS